MEITVQEAVRRINDRTECPGNGQLYIPYGDIDRIELDGEPGTNDIWVDVYLK